MANREVWICSPVRTAIGTYNGTLKDTPAVELGATAIKACLERAGVPGKDVGTVVIGNVIQAGNKMNPARQAAIGGGIPVDVPAMTVNRVCGSGAQAIATAAAEIELGLMDTAVAGGMENMDAAPYLMYGGRWGYRMGNAQIYDAMLQDGLNDAFSGEHSGWHTEDLVTKYQITRRPRTLGRCGHSIGSRRPKRQASSTLRLFLSWSSHEKVRSPSPRTNTTDRIQRLRALPSSSQPSERTAPSRPEMRRD